MIIPSSTHGVIASGRPRVVAAGGGDVTPNPVNWTDQNNILEVYTSTQYITGISSDITLRISWTSLNGGDFTVNILGGPSYPLTTSPTDIVVSNGNGIYFRLVWTGSIQDQRNVTVTNVSDGNTVLDTFSIFTYSD